MMEHLEALFEKDGIPFDHHGNRVRWVMSLYNIMVSIFNVLT